MSENYVFYACIHKHCRSDLACVGAALLKIHILSANLDVGAFACLNNRDDVDSRNTEYYVNILACH